MSCLQLLADAAEKITAVAEHALDPVSISFDGNQIVLRVPKFGERCPAKAQCQEGKELAQALDLAKVGVFEVEASGFERREQGLKAPPKWVIHEGSFGITIRRQNQAFAIGETGGDDVDALASNPKLSQ